MGHERNDEEQFIFSRMAEGDQDAFRFFFDKYYTDLCNFVNIYLHDPMISEEIVQDIFVYLWEKKEKITIDSSVKAYLYRSSKNKSINFLRNEKRKSNVQEKIRGFIDFKTEISDDFLDADELRELIGKAIGNLPGRTREVFILGKENHLSYREIACKLNISEKTVENQMGSALRKLREQLRPYYDKIFLFFVVMVIN
jgi:RNA polymerase sigma-70 factor (ECF subfamily)